MASMIHSIRNFMEDTYITGKFICLYLPVLLLFFIGVDVIQTHTVLFYTIVYYYFGYMIVTMNKALNSSEVSLPNPLLTIFDAFYRGIVALITIIPMIVVAFVLVLWIEGLDTEPVLKYAFIIAGLIICAAVMMLQLTLYSIKYSIISAFNFKIIYEAGGEFFLQILKLLVQMFFIIFLPAYITNLGVSQAFGDTTQGYVIFQIAFYAFIALSIYLTVPQHFVQMYEELVVTNEDKNYLKL